jgi:selenocysteine lyase/cysteine desulfurase
MQGMPDHVNAPEMLFTPAVQNAVRERFHHATEDPISGPRIYLENAGGGLTLKSALTADALVNALPDNAGRENPASREVGRVIQAGRADLRTFLNTPDGTLLADQSTTACAFRILQAAAEGVTGTNIVCSNLDHASFHDAAAMIAARRSLELRIVQLNRSTGALDPEAVAAKVDAGTVCVSIIHASNITGGKTDLAATVRLIRARAPQAIIVADGAQHVQHGVVDVAAAGVDAYVFSAYKVFSKPGFGFAYLSPRLASLPHTQLLGKPATDWDLGTRDAGGFAAFSAVMDYLVWLGTTVAPETASDRRSRVVAAFRAIESHEGALSRRLLHGDGTRPGLAGHTRVVLHGQPHHSEGREAVFAFSIPTVATGQLVQEFGCRRIIVHDRVSDAYSKHTLDALGVTEIVRVSLAHYNTMDEINAFLDALDEILRGV